MHSKIGDNFVNTKSDYRTQALDGIYQLLAMIDNNCTF